MVCNIYKWGIIFQASSMTYHSILYYGQIIFLGDKLKNRFTKKQIRPSSRKFIAQRLSKQPEVVVSREIPSEKNPQNGVPNRRLRFNQPELKYKDFLTPNLGSSQNLQGPKSNFLTETSPSLMFVPGNFSPESSVSDPTFTSDNIEDEVQSEQRMTNPNSFYLQGLLELLKEKSDNQNHGRSYSVESKASIPEKDQDLNRRITVKNSPMIIKLLKH